MRPLRLLEWGKPCSSQLLVWQTLLQLLLQPVIVVQGWRERGQALLERVWERDLGQGGACRSL